MACLSFTTIDRALDAGMNFLDTADVYGRGHNEGTEPPNILRPSSQALLGRVYLASSNGFAAATLAAHRIDGRLADEFGVHQAGNE